MTKSAVLKQNQGFLATLPVGAIIAWHRDLNRAVYIPTLPPGWVECNGQKLDDSESPFHGQDTPNLNGEGRFLRGAAISGELQADQMQSHTHQEGPSGHSHGYRGADYENGGSGMPGNDLWGGSNKSTSSVGVVLGNPTATNSGSPRHGAETRPANMSVIWIMKVKQVVSARVTPVVQAADNAPLGALYVSEKGNLGIGAATPGAKLQVLDGQEYVSLRVGRGDAAGNDFTMDVARGQGLANLVAGAKIKPDGTGYVFLGSRGASRIRLHDGLIDFHTSDETSGVADQNAVGLSLGSAKMTLTNEGNVGIGTASPQARLHVGGDIISKAQVFQARMSANYAIGVGWDEVPFNVAIVNTLSGTFNGAAHTFKASRAGYYHVSVSGFSPNASTIGDRYAIGIGKNGAIYSFCGGNYCLVDTPLSGYTGIVYLNGSTDIISILAFSAIPATWVGQGQPGHEMFWFMNYLGE